MNNMINYPAIFNEEDNKYWCEFIDLPGCYSDGDTLNECVKHAKEALYTHLLDLKKHPKPTMDLSKIKIKKNQVICFVSFNLEEFNKKYSNQSVKKTLSIPAWLNTMAVKEKINFSQVLQEALMKKLDIK